MSGNSADPAADAALRQHLSTRGGGDGRNAVFTHVSLAGFKRGGGATLYGSKWHRI